MVLINCIDFHIAGFDICESDIPYFIRPGSTIRSPNFPNYYENNKECKMTIRFSADQKVKIELISFHTEGDYDPLKVYDGPEGERIANLGGSINSGDTYTSTGNAMYLEFSSDSSTDNSDSYSGFIIIAKAGNENITYMIIIKTRNYISKTIFL